MLLEVGQCATCVAYVTALHGAKTQHLASMQRVIAAIAPVILAQLVLECWVWKEAQMGLFHKVIERVGIDIRQT